MTTKRLTDADLNDLEYGYVTRVEYPPAVEDMAALIAEVRRLRAGPTERAGAIAYVVAAWLYYYPAGGERDWVGVTATLDEAEALACSSLATPGWDMVQVICLFADATHAVLATWRWDGPEPTEAGRTLSFDEECTADRALAQRVVAVATGDEGHA